MLPRWSKRAVAGVLWLALLTPALQAQESRARRRPAAPRPQPAKPQPPQPTRLQIDLFELACPNAHLIDLDVDQVTRGDTGSPSAAEILQRLGSLGDARLMVRIDNVVDLAAASTLKAGKSVPQVQGVTIKPGGKPTPSVSYREIGFTVEVQGRWRDDSTPASGHLDIDLEHASVHKSGLEVGGGVDLPAVSELNITQQLYVTSGSPSFIIANDPLVPGDPDGITYVTVLRVVATRLPVPTSAAAEASAATRIGMVAIELTGEDEPLEELDAQRIAPAGADVETVLQRLAGVGRAEVLGRPTVLVKWPEKATVTIGEAIPTVIPPKTSNGDVVRPPSVDYEEIGLTVELTGRWMTSRHASVQVALEHTALQSAAYRAGEDGIARPLLARGRALLSNDNVRAGENCWLVGPTWRAGDGKGRRILLCLSAQRVAANVDQG